MNIIPVRLEKIETQSAYCNIRSPYAMLSECLKTEDEGVIDQAWLCFAEFSPEYMIG